MTAQSRACCSQRMLPRVFQYRPVAEWRRTASVMSQLQSFRDSSSQRLSKSSLPRSACRFVGDEHERTPGFEVQHLFMVGHHDGPGPRVQQ